MKKKKLSLELNKQIIDQLDQNESVQIKGGEVFLSLWGSNCNNSDPNAHQCCVPATGTQNGPTCTTGAPCNSTTTVNTSLCS